MKFLRKFNESKQVSPFTLSNEDIEDYAIGLTDLGFSIKITQKWINDGKRSDEPISNKSTPYYNIVFNKDDDDSTKNRWNGSYYLDSPEILPIFSSIMYRLKSHGTPYYYIENLTYTIDLFLNEVDTKIGFDWIVFTADITKWFDSIRGNHMGEFEDDLYDLSRTFEMEEGWSGGDSIVYEFSDRTNNNKIKFGEKDDNKDILNVLKNRVLKKIEKFSDHIECKFVYTLKDRLTLIKIIITRKKLV